MSFTPPARSTECTINEKAEDLGAVEEVWVVSRLMWNPDQDVEQLRKYYLRRTFREAAPAIEKFRGAIRAAWYKEQRTVDFDENHEAGVLLRNLGMEKELYGCLDEALKAVKHPQSRILVERMCAAFKDYMAALEYGLERLKSLPLSLRLVCEIHAKLMDGVRGNSATPGKFRRSQNWIGTPGCTLAQAD